MKVRIKSGDCPSYLTVGRVYEVESRMSNTYVWIKNDYGKKIGVFLSRSSHINDGSWEIVDEEA